MDAGKKKTVLLLLAAVVLASLGGLYLAKKKCGSMIPEGAFEVKSNPFSGAYKNPFEEEQP